MIKLEKRIKALESDIERMGKELEELEKELKNNSFPQIGDKYWKISGWSDVYSFTWENDELDKQILAIGNIFKTEEEAEFAIERLKVIAELKKFSREFIRDTYNYDIRFDSSMETTSIGCWKNIKYADLIFESKEKAKEAIEFVGEERVKKYYLGVKE